MKRRSIILICSAIAVTFASLALAFWPGEREPKYQGKKLSEWVQQARDADFDSSKQQNAAQAREAIRSIGTNALPSLLKWVDYAPAPWKLKASGLAKKLPFSDAGDDLRKWLTAKDEKRFIVAIKAFEILGTLAEPAIPRLKEISADKHVMYGAEVLRIATSIEIQVRTERMRAQAGQRQ
jgi:hypothetical protein